MGTIGYVHSLQSMGAVDGPGLRTVVFLQGCPLRCVYCHNPDTWEFQKGQQMTPEAVAVNVLKYRAYLKRGGITVSGGEPLMQPEFVTKLFQIMRQEGIHTALDTSGIGNFEKAEELLAYTDLVLADMKFLTSEDYEQYCKADFEQVVQFLNLTRDKEVPLWIRQVIVPGMNDDEKDVRELKEFLIAYPNVKKIELLPFRKMCMPKYEEMGIEFPLKDVPEMKEADIKKLKELVR